MSKLKICSVLTILVMFGLMTFAIGCPIQIPDITNSNGNTNNPDTSAITGGNTCVSEFDCTFPFQCIDNICQ